MTATDLQRALDACASEPIHLSGAIQPHGALLVYAQADGRIVAASENAARLFELALDAILGQPFAELFERPVVVAVEEVASRAMAPAASQFVTVANVGALGRMHDVSAHLAAGGLVHVELEPVQPREDAGPGSRGAHAAVADMERLADGPGFFDDVARRVQGLAGYARVMVYRFLHDGAGEVVAEAVRDSLPSYLGLRYPVSDIPPQARELYLRNRIRVIPDVTYAPVPVQGLPSLAGPLDLGFDVLRSVSPVHLAYLRNMGVSASMSVSLVVEGRLWGLIACHHDAPRRVSAAQRTALDMLGRHVSLVLDARELRASRAREAALRQGQDALEEQLAGATPAIASLREDMAALAGALPCDGVAVYRGGEWLAHGVAPAGAALDDALRWARARAAGHAAATSAATDWSGAPSQLACGLLATRLAAAADDWLLLFRVEQRETIRWAGRPDEPFQVDASGLRIGPRESFAAWEQEVALTSVPWSAVDLQAAARVRLLLHRYLGRAAEDGQPASLEAQMLDWDAREYAGRLRRLATVVEQAGEHLDGEAGRDLERRIAAVEGQVQALARLGEADRTDA